MAWSPATLPAQAKLKVNSSEVSNYLQCTGYAFTIPTGAVINGITVAVNRVTGQAGCCVDAAVRIVKTGVIGVTDQSNVANWPTVAAMQNYGSGAFLWGNTWTPADINAANFGAALAVTANNGNGQPTSTANSVSITIAYTLGAPTVSKSFSPASVAVSAPSTLTVTLTNPNSVAITGTALGDTYPAGLINASTPGAGTTCAGGTATAAAGGNTLSLSAGTIPASGSCAVTVSVTSNSAGSYANNVAIGAVTSANAPANSVASNTATLTVTGSTVASFNAVEVAAGPAGKLFTKLSGTNFSVDILALDASNAVNTTFSGTVTLALVNASTGGGVCASMASLQALGTLTFAAGDLGRKALTPINYPSAARNAKIKIVSAAPAITACSTDAFSIRPTSFTIGSNMTNSATTGSPALAAGNNFTLTATAIAGYDGTPVIDNSKIAAHAGAVQAGAITGAFPVATVATGISQGTTFTYSEVGNFQFLGQGVFDNSFTSIDSAGECTNDFSNVLVGGKYGCKVGNAANTAFFGRFTASSFVASAVSLINRSALACAPISPFSYMNEALALGFTLTALNAGGVTTQNYTTASGFAQFNPVLPSSFNFVARDGVVANLRSYAVSSITRANPGQITTTAAHPFVTGDRVYITGANGMTQADGQTVAVTRIDSTHFTIGLDTTGYAAYTSGGTVSRLSGLTSAGTWVAGSVDVSATVRLERSAAPDGPYTSLSVGIAPKDADGVGLLNAQLNLDADANTVNDSLTVGTTQERWGRLRMENAFGSELLDLPITLSAEYYNGALFDTNTLDSCTTLAASDFVLSYVAGHPLSACKTAMVTLGALSFNAGKVSAVAPPAAISPMKLARPGSGNEGAVDVTINLNGASGNTCLAIGGAGPAATNANKAYLQSNWGTGIYTENPGMRARFGTYKGVNEIIYSRENF